MHKEFSCRLGNLEARACALGLLPVREGEPITVDIVQWSDKVNWSIAYFQPTGEGSWDLKFVGPRPLHKDVDWSDFRRLIEISLQYLTPVTAEGVA